MASVTISPEFVLDNPNFKEDSVREELITPLLKKLGYSVKGKNLIIRSKGLLHPYVYIGSKLHDVGLGHRSALWGEFVECGDSSPHGSEGDESPHSIFGGLNDDQGYDVQIG